MKTNNISPCRTLLWLAMITMADLFTIAEIQGADDNYPRADPKFSAPIANVTVPVGREAVLVCVVQDLSSFKVAWLRVDTQTILTIHSHVITKNHRIGVVHSERTTWLLRVRDVRESDRGWYMCQINTDPMKSQVGYLDVVVPPDILDYPTSADMVVREGSNVTLRCAATGSPEPSIVWRREQGEPIPLMKHQTEALLSVEGPVFSITRVNRLHMGAYLCIATNGVPPSVSKRVMLIVHFAPMIWIPNQLIGVGEGSTVTLECHSEAYPKSINYWTREKGEIVPQGGRFEPAILEGSDAYKVVMKLTIRNVGPQDYGTYKCVAKNSLGDTDGSIKLYHIPRSALQNYDSDLHKGKNRKQYGHGPNDIRDDVSENVAGQRDLKLRGHGQAEDGVSSSSKRRCHDVILWLAVASSLLTSQLPSGNV